LDVVLKVFIVLAPNVEVQTLVVVTGDNNPMFQTLLVVTFIDVSHFELYYLVFNNLKTSLRKNSPFFFFFNLLGSVLSKMIISIGSAPSTLGIP
jgi:hypothetical protein